MHFTGPTFSGQPGIAPLTAPSTSSLPGFNTSYSPLSSLASQLACSTPNVSNIVTTRLSSVEDYLPWRTQFESFLVSHSLLGVLDGSIPVPSPTTLDYTYWLKIDQTVHSWIFATLARDVLMEVYDLKFYHLIWERLQKRFMSACISRSIELKRLLSHMKKKESQTMDQYLLEIKLLADSLAAINAPVSGRDQIEYAILGLGRRYESVLNNIDQLPGIPSLEDLRPILQAQEQRNLFFQAQESAPLQQAFAAPTAPIARGGGQPRGGGVQPRGRGNRGGRARGGRGRGRGGYYQQNYGGHQQPYVGYPPHPANPQPRAPAFSGIPGFPSVDQSYQSPPPSCMSIVFFPRSLSTSLFPLQCLANPGSCCATHW
ncbi:unnamed protein product [Cuscuta epithymum]|uniref:Retrotransposon gag domain-containing protein n=1 Tax=Cuscuta epithymum TaxID=186058 RepID=A0AAV0DYA6_9ASTE|nr:unnamed protein product [Cuscuta epithymum]CAH9143581.1 unnamed protein product [Cuscuta epithymum]